MMAPPMPIAPEEKSIAVSLVLTFFFGPLGMLYSTVLGFVVMFVVNLVVLPITLGIGIVLTWPACMLWAALAASDHNTKVRHQWAAQQAFQQQQAQIQQHAYQQQQTFAHQQHAFDRQQRAFQQQPDVASPYPEPPHRP